VRRKVCEITSVDYVPNGQHEPKDSEGELSERFEDVIDLEDKSGYELESWQLSSCSTDEVRTRTIVAVFKERPT
jgi:hypothetical protein